MASPIKIAPYRNAVKGQNNSLDILNPPRVDCAQFSRRRCYRGLVISRLRMLRRGHGANGDKGPDAYPIRLCLWIREA